jgi:DNA-binding transcriptional MocR family regulator
MNNSFPIVQLSIKPGVLDLAWGQPDPKLLPVAEMQRAGELALKQYGADMLGYGADAGAGPLLDYLWKRIQEREGRALTHEQIMVTGGNSDALDKSARISRTRAIRCWSKRRRIISRCGFCAITIST